MNSAPGGKTPAVSVVISTYKRPGYLREALDSVYRQTFTDYEVIVVDDGSGPETTQTYELRDNTRLICHETPQRGCAATKNTGTRAARGRYVAYLDDDDTWYPEKLAAQVRALDENPEVALAHCHVTLVDESMRPVPEQPKPKPVPRDGLRRLAHGNFIKSPSVVMLRREVFEELGGFDEVVGGAEDWEMWMRIANKHSLYCIPEPLAYYRVHGSQLTGKSLTSRRADARVFEKMLAWARKEAPRARWAIAAGLSYRLQRLARWEAWENGSLAGVRTAMRAIRACPVDPRGYLRIPQALLLGVWGSLRRRHRD